MIIGIEAQRLLRPHKHGMDIVALETIRALAAHRDHEFVVFVKPDTDRACLPDAPNLHVVDLHGGPYPVWEQWALPKAVKQAGVDLLHCTANTAPLRSSVPVIVTLHDIIFLEKAIVGGTAYQQFGNVYRRWNVPSVVKTADRILTVSHYERERIIDHLRVAPERVITVHNAVSPTFRVIDDLVKLADVQASFALPDEFIFFLGNADPKKNVPNVLRALLLLKQRGQLTLPLVMANVSAGYVDKVLAETGTTALKPDIILCGYIPNPLLPAVYNLATVFLCPSLRESFGLPILESMACGTPVLTASTSAMPEVAGDAALLADPASPQAMADQLARLLTDTDLCLSLRQRGLERAALFSWANTAKQLLDVYAGVL
ncbi:glycosyltransferase family 4 protein [Fibrella forsythiae]|uniref:Glycosyltransferase family 4 protein n=1 Tax=Fibrella forsythiae TaxID=2817061 RepID=A0ABS3JJS9_9BACT|nr:glycosyltransferase family 1 protein [Fibrella forsythiae]MBO0950260.1 glycosyltransferase family 4 protein [Fibrella forsythiae]